MSQSLFQESYQKTLFMESLKYKKELTLAESIFVLQNDEYYLAEGLFGKLGGMADKAVETVTQKIIDSSQTIVKWVNQNVLKGKGKPNPQQQQQKLVANNVANLAKLAGTNKETFFQKASKWAGTSYIYVQNLYNDLNNSLEKIPLVGKFIKMVPAKYRTMILGVVVMIVARQYISGGGDASGNQEYDLDKIVDANIDDAKIDVKIDEVNYAINQTQDPEGNHKILSALSEYIGKAIKAGTLTPETALEKLQHIDVLKGDKAKTFLDMTIQGTDMSDDYDKLMGGSAGNTQTTPDASQKTPNDEKTFHSSDYKDEKSDKVIHATDYNANEQLQKFDDLKDKINDALTKHPDRSKEVYQTLARVVRKLMNSNTVTYDEVLDKLHNIKNLDGDKGKKFMDLAIQ